LNKTKKEIIKVTISSGTEKPYYIKRYGMSPKGCFIRMGSSTSQMSKIMIENLYSKRVRNSLKNIVSPKQNLTFVQLKIYYEEKDMVLNDHFKENLELLTEDEKYNYNAYLLSDNNGLSMKVAKYSGKTKVDLIENEEFGYCSIIKATNNILNKLQIENVNRTKITEKRREEKRLIDQTALREAVINAIVHNEYSGEIPPLFEIFSDRFVITSYGTFPESLSKEEVFDGLSAPKNRELMRIFKDLGFVEHLGSGIPRILEKYDKSVFVFLDNFIRVEFKFEERNKYSEKFGEKFGVIFANLNSNQKKILELIHDNKKITQSEIALNIGISVRAIEKNTSKLQELGILKRIGPAKGGHWEVVFQKDKS
jgi:predicted HTH transcriptional regulator